MILGENREIYILVKIVCNWDFLFSLKVQAICFGNLEVLIPIHVTHKTFESLGVNYPITTRSV